ncbi:MAG: hypothetical protein GEU82_00145 [Luteitalea sp.]|nr:hypothetical protein [Luteitalea sp.]
MQTKAAPLVPHTEDSEWLAFPGGELEGRQVRIQCAPCRERLRGAASARQSGGKGPVEAEGADANPSRQSRPALCFACYRWELVRDRALRAAGDLDTATEARFQSILPLEAVDRGRLTRLRAERSVARAADRSGAARHVDRRRHAQIAARHALQQIGARLRMRNEPGSIDPVDVSAANRLIGGAQNLFASAAAVTADASAEWSAIHAAELQLPEAWIPFVVSR